MRAGSGSAGLWLSPASDALPWHEAPLTDATLAAVEGELGVRLPAAYAAIAREHNGGRLARTTLPTDRATTWALDHVALSNLFPIGSTAHFSLCGPAGNRFWLDEWGYPALGVYIADTPSAGHDLLALDYRSCGPRGEPAVVHVDEEAGFAVTVVSRSFEAFVRALLDEGGSPTP